MTQLDAVRLAAVAREKMVGFAVDDKYVRDERLAEIARRIWSGPAAEGGLLSDLWVEGAFPAKQSTVTLDSLVGAGRFDSALAAHLDRDDAIPRHRALYTHQAEALEQAMAVGAGGERPAVVVTAGTGAGKTESFLLPVLNDLRRHPAPAGGGVRCIILYPMNALVNDQVDRLYGWLKGQTGVTLFNFTGETPEDKRRADREQVPSWDPCRIRTRQQARGLETAEGKAVDPAARGRVPDIIITNYSMLEYMLCRPQDSVFFGPALRSIVLDEAHLYTGTLAAEITLLLRRLYARCGVRSTDLLQIATSATLGTGAKEELQGFAATIFSKPLEHVQVVKGQATRVELSAAQPPAVEPHPVDIASGLALERPLLVQEGGRTVLARDAALCERLRRELPMLVAEGHIRDVHNEEDHPAALLHKTLAAAPLVHRAEQALWEGQRLPLLDLAHHLFGSADMEAVQATTRLLQVGASARLAPGDYPLLPHRIHLLVRPADGLCVCLNPDCSGPVDRKLDPLGTVHGGTKDRCPDCGHATLSLHRCSHCGEWLLGGEPTEHGYRPVMWASDQAHYFTHTPVAGTAKVVLNRGTGIPSGHGADGVELSKVSECPNCQSERHFIGQFNAGTPLTLAILAETVLAELPEFPSAGNHWLPARGRRLLAFSDSRQEAARLGPRLTRQHETQLTRRAILETLTQMPVADAATIGWLRAQLASNQALLANATGPLRQTVEQDVRRVQRQIQAYMAGGSMDDWSQRLSQNTLLAERVHAETSRTHQPERWGQGEWDKNTQRVKEEVKLFLGVEFARRASPLETLALAEITYPGLERLTTPPEFLGALAGEVERQALSGCWPLFLESLCDSMRSEGAVTFGSSEEDAQFPHEGLVGRWCGEESESGAHLVAFVGKTPAHRRRWFAATVLRACGVGPQAAEDAAAELLRVAYRQLRELAIPLGQIASDSCLAWVQRSVRENRKGPSVDAIRLVFPQLGLRRPAQVYRCERTQRIFPRSVLGCAPEKGCDQTLHGITHDELDADRRVGMQRRAFLESKTFTLGLWAEEHSAQLAPRENRRLQDLFKSGIRNILSATTTLELGIDIGGLNAVLMSNVPPGKANYLQRAGRAGRRADGSSLVVTFARSRPFDQQVFLNFGSYLGRGLRRPLVFLDRERLVRRHFHSFLLGSFFQEIYPPDTHVGTMSAFGRMGEFCGVPLPPRWDKFSKNRPSIDQSNLMPLLPRPFPWWNPACREPGLEPQFICFLHWVRDWGEEAFGPLVEMLFRDTVLEELRHEWFKLLQSVIDDFAEAVGSWRYEYDGLLLGWYVAEAKPHCNALRYQLSALHDLTVIEALADRQFLPHYGFPIGVQKLRVIAPDEEHAGRVREEDQYRLERSSLLALREYVPGSQLLVGGRLVSSRGLLKHWTGASLDSYIGLRGQFNQCTNGHFYYWLSTATAECRICGAGPAQNAGHMLFPKHGFSGAAWDPPRFSTEVERVGSAETATMTFSQQPSPDSLTLKRDDFAGLSGFTVQYRENGELLVYNRGDEQKGFAICLKCGYAESEVKTGQARMKLPKGFEYHAPLDSAKWWHRCWRDNDAPVLRNEALAARETTDVLLLDFTACLGPYARHEALVTTFAYALQRSGAQLLEMDTRELGVMVVPAGVEGRGLGVVLYDNVPGGAGHVRELVERGGEWLAEARRVLYVSPEHDLRCDTACLECLLTFDAQEMLSRRLFDRRLALAFLERLLRNERLPEPNGNLHEQEAAPTAQTTSERWARRNELQRRRR